jgi:hypothetical protein
MGQVILGSTSFREIHMANTTFPLPTAAEAMTIAVNRKSKNTKTVVVADDQKLALVLLELNSAVTPDDYASLGTQIQAITGIQGVNLVINGITRPSVEAGEEQIVVVDAHLRTRDVPETP